jgi:hypothetical protein
MAPSSWQKPRFLPAATELMSAKAPQATFANELELARPEGFKPPTLGSEDRCSIR